MIAAGTGLAVGGTADTAALEASLEAVERSGTALLRVERMPGREANATVLAGLAIDAEATAIERAAQFIEPAAVLAPRL